MILYHFCAAHMKDNIIAEGLTEGQFPHFEGNDLKPFLGVNGSQLIQTRGIKAGRPST